MFKLPYSTLSYVKCKLAIAKLARSFAIAVMSEIWCIHHTRLPSDGKPRKMHKSGDDVFIWGNTRNRPGRTHARNRQGIIIQHRIEIARNCRNKLIGNSEHNECHVLVLTGSHNYALETSICRWHIYSRVRMHILPWLGMPWLACVVPSCIGNDWYRQFILHWWLGNTCDRYNASKHNTAS